MAGMEPVKSLSVRFPEMFYAAIAAEAKKDRRSINSEILTLIEEALSARWGVVSTHANCEVTRPKSGR